MENKAMAAVWGDNGQEKVYAVENWEWVNSGCLQASFTLIIIPYGLRILHCSLFCKGCSRWVSVPSERFRGEDGRTAYKPLIGFRSSAAKADFLHAALEAVDRYLESYSPSEAEDGRSAVALFDDDDCAEGSEVGHVL
jgi:hypothetical protein